MKNATGLQGPLLSFLDGVVTRHLYVYESPCAAIPRPPIEGISVRPYFAGEDLLGSPIGAGFTLVSTDDAGRKSLEQLASSLQEKGTQGPAANQRMLDGRRYIVQPDSITQLYK